LLVGVGVFGVGFGPQTPTPQPPIPNPQSPIFLIFFIINYNNKIKKNNKKNK